MSQHRDLDVTKRDRFELLSAYLDGEVSPAERRLVTTWLESDAETQCLYRRLLQLRQGFQGICREQWQMDTDCQTSTSVITRLNQRLRLTCMAGMTAAAVAVLGVFSGAMNHPMGLMPSSLSWDDRDHLEIALDQPPIMIPKPAIAGESPLEAGDNAPGDGGLSESAM